MTVTNPVTGEVKSSDVVISKAISTTAISSETFPNGVTLTANVLPGNISGEVVFTINGNQDYSEDVADSKASITLRNLDSGKYTAVVTFNGNSNYNASTSSQITFDIDEYDYVISAPDVTKYYGEPEKFNITLTKNNVPVVNANVKITLNDVDYTKNTDKNGKISMNISDLNVGVYDVVVKYNSITVNSVITVNQASTKISWSASKLTTVYNGNKNLIATLVDSTGNPIVGAKVTIKLSNGNTQTPTTDSNGQVKLSANGLAPVKTYTATVTFAGNANYKKSTATAKITVKKATPKLTAKAKTFKKSVKTKKYSITLKTNQNKVMKNTKVTLKVNGKTYSAKTNAKGQATFKITKLTKKGKYTAVVKFAGNKYYNAKTVKPKITVK
ncbi:Ig-like domain repeat protein [Methanobrevibacter sp. UBA188]